MILPFGKAKVSWAWQHHDTVWRWRVTAVSPTGAEVCRGPRKVGYCGLNQDWEFAADKGRGIV